MEFNINITDANGVLVDRLVVWVTDSESEFEVMLDDTQTDHVFMKDELKEMEDYAAPTIEDRVKRAIDNYFYSRR
jgi:hypothetical protein